MGAVIDFIVSVNKISLLAFLGVLGFLLYEISLLRKEHLKKQKPSIPQFNPNVTVNKTVVQQQAAAVVKPVKATPINSRQSKVSPLLIAILVLMIILFLGFSVYILKSNKSKNQTLSATQNVVIQEISSPGLKVFDSSWIEIKDMDASKAIKPGQTVYIGIQTIEEADIDRARIKVNSKDWNIQDITNKFNKEKRVYYKEYIIASSESKLKIDAQLHSAEDGWLGD